MAGQVAMGGTPHPHIFARKPSTSILIPIPLQRFQTINAFPLQNSPFSHFFIKRALSKFPSSSSTNPSFKRTPNLFTFTSKSLRIHLGLHQGSSISTISSQGNTKGNSSTLASTSSVDWSHLLYLGSRLKSNLS